MSYIGPEHILGALVDDAGSGASRLLGADEVDMGKLRGATDGAPRPDGAPATAKQPATTLDEYGRDLTEEAKAGRLDPRGRPGRGDRVDRAGSGIRLNASA